MIGIGAPRLTMAGIATLAAVLQAAPPAVRDGS
jgi:hypothetical protein